MIIYLDDLRRSLSLKLPILVRTVPEAHQRYLAIFSNFFALSKFDAHQSARMVNKDCININGLLKSFSHMFASGRSSGILFFFALLGYFYLKVGGSWIDFGNDVNEKESHGPTLLRYVRRKVSALNRWRKVHRGRSRPDMDLWVQPQS